MPRELMNLDHARWKDFALTLRGWLRIKVAGGSGAWRYECDVTQNKAREILAEMPGIDVKQSLEWMTVHGGCCDCEIIFNIDEAMYLGNYEQTHGKPRMP